VIESLLTATRTAVAWWIEGLWLGVPTRLRAFFEQRPQIVVRLVADTAHVEFLDESRNNAAITSIAFDDPEPAVKLGAILAAAANADVTALLPRSIALARTLTLPAGAANALRDVLVHELDRLTPFPPNEIVFDYRIRERSNDKLVVDVVLARRDSLDAAVATLVRLGLRPTAATTADDASARCLDLLPRRPLRLPFARIPVTPRIAAAAAAALLLALYVPLWRYATLSEEYANEANAARNQAVAARAALEEQESALARTDFLATRRATYTAPIALLLDLTRELPEHTWLIRMQLTTNEVLLQGESATAPELLQLVESMERLEGAQFQTPVARNDASGKDQFTIVAAPQRGNP
jgi:general secretion pathway protein L